MICNNDCFNCPYEDCINDSIEYPDFKFDYELDNDLDLRKKTNESKKEYNQRYYTEHKEYFKEYHNKNAERKNENGKRWSKENRERVAAAKRKYYRENIELQREKQREYRKRKKQEELKYCI